VSPVCTLRSLADSTQQNTFFTELGIDLMPLIAVDLMHDVELGFSKGITIHILRLLLALGQHSIDEYGGSSC
jgi:hypothetical protein